MSTMRHPGDQTDSNQAIYRTGSSGSGGSFGRMRTDPPPPPQSGAGPSMGNPFDEEQGVEVVLDHGASKVVEESPPRGGGGQDVFRGPGVQRPRPLRPGQRPPPQGHPPPPHAPASGSFGYGPPPYRPSAFPNQTPYDAAKGSYEEGGGGFNQQRHAQSQHSPQVHYPQPGGYQNEDVNVISPNQRNGDPRYNRPPGPQGGGGGAPQNRQMYRYPPTSPVSRPHHSPPRNKPPQQMSGRRMDPVYSHRGDAYHPNDGTFNAYSERPQVVAETSFDSEQYGHHYGSHPPTPHGDHPFAHPPTPQQSGSEADFYGHHSWNSFDANMPPPHFDDQRYYGYPPHPEGQYYPDGGHLETPYPSYGDGRPYTDDAFFQDYHQDGNEPAMVSPEDKKGKFKDLRSSSGIMLPKAAAEVDFEVTKPPSQPVAPPGEIPLYNSIAEVNQDDVLCGRGGGTNSQIGNRRFRQLVHEFQPTYLLARRKEKPLLARTIVLIIRKRGGHFLKKNEDTGELFEVGDAKAEAKTSQALREGLDVRATRSAANAKAKKNKTGKGKDSDAIVNKSAGGASGNSNNANAPPPSPPPMPRLQGGGDLAKSGMVHPHSPEALNFRKRRRMRSKDGNVQAGCGVFNDRLFMDFCPPRADLGRSGSPMGEYSHDPMDMSTPPRPGYNNQGGGGYDDDAPYAEPPHQNPGCTDIAMMAVMGAATGSFCLGPSKWRGA